MPHDPSTPGRSDAAERLLTKLRVFADGLDPDERTILAALIGPGIEVAHADDDPVGDNEVEGYGGTWSAGRLPEQLVAAVRGRDLRIEGW